MEESWDLCFIRGHIEDLKKEEQPWRDRLYEKVNFILEHDIKIEVFNRRTGEPMKIRNEHIYMQIRYMYEAAIELMKKDKELHSELGRDIFNCHVEAISKYLGGI